MPFSSSRSARPARDAASTASASRLPSSSGSDSGKTAVSQARVCWRGSPPQNSASVTSPDTLLSRSHAAYDDATDLKAMIRANLIAERVAIEAYSQIIALIGDKDSTTRRLLEDILSDEQEHAEELKDWLAD